MQLQKDPNQPSLNSLDRIQLFPRKAARLGRFLYRRQNMGGCLCLTTALCRIKPSASKMVGRPSLKPHSGLACCGGGWAQLLGLPGSATSSCGLPARTCTRGLPQDRNCMEDLFAVQGRGEDRSVQSWPAQAGGACGPALSDRGLTSLCLFLVQSLPAFQLQQDSLGKLLLEDGKGRCPFDPEYRSTAIMVGKELWGSQRGHPERLWVEVEGLLPARKDDLP